MEDLSGPFNANYWEHGTGRYHDHWRCIVCPDQPWFANLGHARRHRATKKHSQSVEFHLRTSSLPTPNPLEHNPSVSARVREPLMDLLRDIQGSSSSAQAIPDIEMADPPPLGEPVYEMSFTDDNTTELQASTMSMAMERLAEEMETFLLDDDHTSQSSGSDTLPDEQVADFELYSNDPLAFGQNRPAQRSKPLTNPEWFPWPDKAACIFDIFRHVPRGIFSESQMELILWALNAFGVDNAPSIDVMKSVDEYLQSLCGIHTRRYTGALGHVYYMNDLAGIIRQEMANPLIRKHLHHYPEDSGRHIEHAWQAEAWRNQDVTMATPMIRRDGQDFYIFEMTRLTSGQLVVPFRWYTRGRHGIPSEEEQDLYAMAWTVVNAAGAYLVDQNHIIQVPVSSLLSSLPRIIETFAIDGLLDPRNIGGIIKAGQQDPEPWQYTTVEDGFLNRWRIRSRGHPVYSFPMWLYCDDTSGNVSKKWNKHNSFLFTAAGLSREHVHKQSNIHFLSTSNLAPPLEMLDGVVEQLERGQAEGYWAWDVELREMVLVFPSVLAMLGDNPMQSEFACHVGLTGKFFCRCCWAKGKDADHEESEIHLDNVDDNASVQSDTSEVTEQPGKRKRHVETMGELVARAKRFLGDNSLRTKTETVAQLHSIFTKTSTIYGKTEAKKLMTASGTKDTFLEHFRDRVFTFIAKLPRALSRDEKQAKVDHYIKDAMPANIFSPVWRIKDFDPHRDTPVEILHVVLLGFVKYYWRDAISRLSDEQKKVLTHRLSSMDVSGLGFSPLKGETLVQFAGSLTGSNFRAIAQVAPFVLYDLIPKPCFEAWLALSALIPLVWQPVIADIEEYLPILQAAIDRFLNCAAEWTPRWFNKPKFHIIKHLPMHIRRFGPAMLYATEGFESFNAVIRDHSVHSNHQAPSRDIARGFARCNRNRHILSRGMFPTPESTTRVSTSNEIPPDTEDPWFHEDPSKWVTAGPLPLALIRPRPNRRNIVAEALGLVNPDHASRSSSVGSCFTILHRKQSRSSLITRQRLPSSLEQMPASRFNTFKTTTSSAFDLCSVEDFVLVGNPHGGSTVKPVVARICEIIQVSGGADETCGKTSGVLVTTYNSRNTDSFYKVPRLECSHAMLVPPQNILCRVNVQHNCAANTCDMSATRTVYQERERTEHTVPRIRHYQPDDLLLNTNQMTSAIYVQQLRHAIAPLNREQAILTGAAREIAEQKAKGQSKGKGKVAASAANTSSNLPAISVRNPVIQNVLAAEASTATQRRLCGRCHQPGHNSRTCPQLASHSALT
ncbi:hypothetical protein F5878DRAFT_628111 [Lentinula raphanica]|uniref:CCHC-type domain-containing protein n=1 Tax=Lentinula raphanica TaxID=153919 RepID=A0AA38P2Y9_9AGAR|nr:hypothetical protein F5878DRAFT_628111 [Lentinula raphanica]